MKIHYLSDLHLEFNRMPRAYRPPEGTDVVVLAGDIGVGLMGLEWAIQNFGVPVVYIPGNHEFYGQRPMQKLLAQAREKAAAAGNVYFLENESVWIDGVRFAGATLWTDFAILPAVPIERVMEHAAGRMSDYREITIEVRQASRVYRSRKTLPRLTPRMALARHHESRDFIEREARELGEGERLVIVTHHAPSPQSLIYREATNLLDAAYVSNLEPLVASSGADFWIHGHLHNANDYVIGGTRVLSNCRGYADIGVDAGTGFDQQALVEI